MRPAEDLRRYSFHTGTTIRPLAPEETCPVLFRDLGPAALLQFLRGELPRLAGPLTPLLYTRTADFQEPYTDYERTGRVVLLNPRTLPVWHSGVPEVYVARATHAVPWQSIAFIPGTVDQRSFAARAADLRHRDELREELGGAAYDELRSFEAQRMAELVTTLDASERLAEPLRRRLQQGSAGDRLRVREALARELLTEHDLCAAWHHISRERREALDEGLPRVIASLETACSS